MVEQEPGQNENGGTKSLQVGERTGDWARYKSALTAAKDRAISSVGLKVDEGTFTENEEDRVHMLLRTHFPGFYSRAAGDNILPDTPTTNKRGRKENQKLAEEICSEARVKRAVETLKPLKSPGLNGVFPALI